MLIITKVSLMHICSIDVCYLETVYIKSSLHKKRGGAVSIGGVATPEIPPLDPGLHAHMAQQHSS